MSVAEEVVECVLYIHYNVTFLNFKVRIRVHNFTVINRKRRIFSKQRQVLHTQTQTQTHTDTPQEASPKTYASIFSAPTVQCPEIRWLSTNRVRAQSSHTDVKFTGS